MPPISFTFKLTLPRDPALDVIVTGVAAHAVAYTEMDKAAGAAFVTQVAAATAAELRAAEPARGRNAGCLIVITSADGELRLTIGSQTISQKISA
jgi:hypothetical protein